MCDKKDIFDKIMSLRVFAPIYPFYKKHKEVLMYLFFGALTTVISIVTFSLFFEILKINELISNVISWIVAVLFAFVTNRIWVFEKGKNEGIILQGIKFYGGRVATLLIEEIILLVFVTLLSFNAMVVKITAQVIVIVLNYVISKAFIFKK